MRYNNINYEHSSARLLVAKAERKGKGYEESEKAFTK